MKASTEKGLADCEAFSFQIDAYLWIFRHPAEIFGLF